MKIAVAVEVPPVSADGGAQPVAAPEAAGMAVRALRYSRMSVAVGVLAVIALIAALYLARAFFVPLLIGILASYTLHPVVDWLQKALRIPRPVAAAS